MTSLKARPVGGSDLPAGPDDGLDGAIIEVTVGAVAHGGHCVSRHDGRVVFVRHALPGERVRALVTEQHSSFLRADAVEILEASPRRVAPPCPWAGPGLGYAHGAPRAKYCGGCDLQHADLAYQRELKTAVLREQLIRLGGLDESTVDRLAPVVRPLPAVPGEPDGQGWRTRVQYTVDSTGRAGLLAHRSHEVVAVDRCLIAHAAVRDTDVLRRDWPDHGVAVASRHVIEVVAGEPSTVLARRADASAVVVSGPETVTERAVGRSWRLPPTAFWQVHPSAADTLAAAVVELLAPRPGDRIWDLYGGVGLFAAALAPHADPAGDIEGASQRSEERIERGAGPSGSAGRITVVEGDAAAVAAARECLRDLTTVTVVHSDVAKALRNARWRAVDLVVLDPPRSGAGPEVVAAVAARGPRAVAYVACDPAALARDIRTFRSFGYELTALRAYDLFPHTHHLEAVALLTTA
ncbi:MAG TPA: TRAM domain-containing protein [Jiangellales bacterium]|nr:TRAM domain-containing protein [Jiangellales bacterium]